MSLTLLKWKADAERSSNEAVSASRFICYLQVISGDGDKLAVTLDEESVIGAY